MDQSSAFPAVKLSAAPEITYQKQGCTLHGQQRLILQLKRDILMSFKDQIYEMNGIIKRQENEFFTYINDDKLPIDCRRLVTGFKFPGGFSNTDELLLLVNGKGGGVSNE